MDREVVAVDAMADNLAYIRKSLALANKEDLVTLAHNAISDDHQILYPVQFDGTYGQQQLDNPGSFRVIGQDELLETKDTPLGPGVKSVTLPDIFSTISANTLILKMDIQGYECKALMTPGMFTSGKFIPYIFMEWDIITAGHKASLCTNLDALIDLLKSNGYSAFYINPLGFLGDECLHSKINDILWMHESAKPLWDDVITSIECV